MMMLLFLVLLVLTLGGGGWGYSRYGAVGGMGPVGVFLLIVLVLWSTGNLHA